jgi:hypothetical protein
LYFIGPKNSHPKINWNEYHFQFSLVFGRWRGHWLEGRILNLPLDKGNKLKEGSWEVYQAGERWLFFLGERLKIEGGGGICERKLVLMCVRGVNSYVCESVVHERDVWKQIAWKEVCVANSCNGVHGRISMNKPLDSCFK